MQNIIKKLIPYLFVLIALVGLFGFAGQVNAQKPLPEEGTTPSGGQPETPYEKCIKENPDNTGTCAGREGDPSNSGTKTAFEQEVDKNKCGIMNGSIYPGCFIQLFYVIFYIIPSWILWACAYFFNVIVFSTLSGALLKHDFVSEAWGVVRDLSNIFFILILLYIAIKIILDLAGHEAKKMIAKVIIIALLINFSMFFTQVIIDTSNIIALIFYNKIEVSTKGPNDKERPYQKTGYNDKDVAGGIVNAFNPTKLITPQYLNQAKTTTIDANGTEKTVEEQRVSPSIIIGMLLIAGALMFFASYSLFVAGLSFLGRLIELFVLIIFSPFAFVSSTIPLLNNVEYLGWDAWFKRLLKASFMAPIFMFFLYFIFMLIHADIFKGLASPNQTRLIESILSIVLPALLILILILKATDFAKKGSGKFGEVIMSGAKLLGGVALGAATGGASMLGTTVIGGGGGALLGAAAKKVGPGRISNMLQDTQKFVQGRSYDVRGIKIAGKTLGSATGMNIGEARKGGWSEMKKQQVEKRQKRAEELEKRGTGKEKTDVEDKEIKLKEATLPVKLDLEKQDKLIDQARIDLNDAKNAGNAAAVTEAEGRLNAAKQEKARIRGAEYKDPTTGAVILSKVTGGIADLETDVRTAKHTLTNKEESIAKNYAEKIMSTRSKILNSVFRLGAYSSAGADEAARKIRTGTKIDSGEKPH